MAPLSFLSSSVAAQLDADLMSKDVGYSVDQLMELAGLSVADAVYVTYPPPQRVLVVCGPGNNGGDGLVAARHLKQFDYRTVTVLYPKQSSNELYQQLHHHRVPVHCSLDAIMPKDNVLSSCYDVILDAVFGFSFKGAVRDPFGAIITAINESKLPVVSVDVPSGWNIEEGPVKGTCYIEQPAVIISLTAPKECLRKHNATARQQCRHFLGGRFVPTTIVEKYKLQLPDYPGCGQLVELTNLL